MKQVPSCSSGGAWRWWGTLAGSREVSSSGEVGFSTGVEIATLRQCYWTHVYPADGQEKDVQTL